MRARAEAPRRRSGRGWLALAALVLAPLTGVLAYGYVVTEAYIEDRRPVTLVYDAHPFARQVLRPEQRYRHRHVAFDVGPHGHRGAAPAIPKPPDTTRVIAVGGSAVFDHHVSNSWPERLAHELRLRGRPDVESFNFGVPGYSTRETLALYQDRVHRYAPDVVVVYPGWNDVKYLRAFLERADVERHFSSRRAFAARYRFLTAPRPWRNLLALERMWRTRDSGGVLLENAAAPARARPPIPASAWASSAGVAFFTRNVRALVRQVRADGGTCVLVAQASLATPDLPPAARDRVVYRFVGLSHDELVAAQRSLAQALRRVAEEEGVPFLDPRPALDGRVRYFADHVHLTSEGSQALARIVADGLRDALPPAPESLAQR